MKIIFKNEEERLKFFRRNCIEEVTLCKVEDCGNNKDCVECWEKNGINITMRKEDEEILMNVLERIRKINVSGLENIVVALEKENERLREKLKVTLDDIKLLYEKMDEERRKKEKNEGKETNIYITINNFKED